jgi:hypothetical protein
MRDTLLRATVARRCYERLLRYTVKIASHFDSRNHTLKRTAARAVVYEAATRSHFGCRYRAPENSQRCAAVSNLAFSQNAEKTSKNRGRELPI